MTSIEEAREALWLSMEDLRLYLAGDWEPDDDSVAATLENLQVVDAFLCSIKATPEAKNPEPMYVVFNHLHNVVGQEETLDAALNRAFQIPEGWVRYDTGKYSIDIYAEGARGYFEHNELGDESAGGLWLERRGKRLVLTDFDGVFELPREARMALVGMGIDLTEVGYDHNGDWQEGLI